MKAYGSFKDTDKLYLQLDFIKGCELLSQIKSKNHLVKRNMPFYGAEVICAIEHLHNCNVLFRDLKPEHVIIDDAGHCNLVDFGFAKQFKANRARKDMKTYTNCGTPTYIAPEVLRGTGTSFQADLWSFGVMLCEIASGRTPFENQSPMKTYENVIYCRPHYSKAMDGDLIDLLEGIFMLDP